jgi:hypothetical protein
MELTIARESRLFSPGRKAGDRFAKHAFSLSIPGLPAWAIKDFSTFMRNRQLPGLHIEMRGHFRALRFHRQVT